MSAVDGAASSAPGLLVPEGHQAPGEPAGTGAETVLRAEDVVVRYGGIHAVQGVSLHLSRGEILGLIGPNGAGKSSLLAALGGQLHTRGGKIFLGGRDVTGSSPANRARLGLARTFQTTSEFEGLTVYENLTVAGRGAPGASLAEVVFDWRGNRAAEAATRRRTWDVLERFDMGHVANLYGRELSGGQRRLVEVMRCLMQDPSVLLLDEPMVGVAPHLVARLISDLRSVARGGIGLIIVEHALDVVRELSDRVVVMALGKVIAEGSYEDVVANQAVRDAYIG